MVTRLFVALWFRCTGKKIPQIYHFGRSEEDYLSDHQMREDIDQYGVVRDARCTHHPCPNSAVKRVFRGERDTDHAHQ